MSKPPLDDLFTFRTGRRNRKSYIISMSLLLGIGFALSGVTTVLAPGLPDVARGLLGFVILIVAIPLLLAQFAVMTQRCRDMGWTGWLTLLNFVPVASLVLQVILFIKPGTPGGNRFGTDPRMAGATGPSAA